MSAPSDPQKPQQKSDFQAAEEIVGILEGRDETELERILRWVGDKLGLAATAAGRPNPVPAVVAPTSTSVHLAHSGHPSPTGTATTNIKTFVTQKRPKNDIQFASVVAYFHRFEAPEGHRKDTIDASDIESATRLVGRDRFKKAYVPLNNAVQQGYLDRAGGGAFKLNAVGENLVAMTLPGIDRQESKPHPRKPKSSQQTSKRLKATKKS